MDQFVACDACGQRSYGYAEMPSGLELSYCAHHFREYEPKLRLAGANVWDMSHMVEA